MRSEDLILKISGLGGSALAEEMRRILTGGEFPEVGALSDVLYELLRTNSDLWLAESEARVRFRPWKLPALKKKIDKLNSRRMDLVVVLDTQVNSLTRTLAREDAQTLHDSVGQLLDRLTIECLRIEYMLKLEFHDQEIRQSEIASASMEISAILNRLSELANLLTQGAHVQRARPKKKIYSFANPGNAPDRIAKRLPAMPKQAKDFSLISEKVAMDLHRDFQQDMRSLRDEEFKLADIYMKVATFAGGAAVVLLTTKKFTEGLAVGVIVLLISLWLLLLIYAKRIHDNHKTYALLGEWVMRLRAAHASSAFFYSELDAFGHGKGAWRQIRSLAYLAFAVSTMVTGALILNAYNQFQVGP